MEFDFPNDFLWGTATSSYQIEGAAHEDGKKQSIWDLFCQIPGKVLNGDTGDIAADHYHRWKEDVLLMAKLGIKAYRFSLAWPRIIPEGTGKINPKGLEFYDKLIDELLKHEIEPMITLYHWDLPQALQEKGGWTSRDTVDAFVQFALISFKQYSDRVKLWITHNEPSVVAGFGYWNGSHAPGISDPSLALTVGHHLLLSHGRAVEAMRVASPAFQGKIGLALNLSPIYPENPAKKEDNIAAKLYDAFTNRFFLDGVFKGTYPKEMQEAFPILADVVKEGDMATINTPVDFLGINYYSRTIVKGEVYQGNLYPVPVPAAPNPHSLMWDFYPQGLKEVLEDVVTNYSPKEIYITENGTAVDDVVSSAGEIEDAKRIEFIKAHLYELYQMIQAGIPIKGYFVWSLLDNFEWALGYQRRFGIVYVDFNSLERKVKASGFWYGKIAKQNRLRVEEEL